MEHEESAAEDLIENLPGEEMSFQEAASGARWKRALRMGDQIVHRMKASADLLWGETLASTEYVVHDLRANRRDFFIAFCTIVVAVTALICGYSLIQKGPLVFLKVTENMVGEFDLVITADPRPVYSQDHPLGTGNYSSINAASPLLLNATAIHHSIQLHAGEVSRGAAPRWTILGRAVHRMDARRNITAMFVALDFDLETELGIGRSWSLRALADREAYVSAPLLYALGVTAGVGERIVLDINAGRMLESVGLDPTAVQNVFQDAFLESAHELLNGSSIVLDLSNATSVQMTLEHVFNASIPLPIVQGFITAVGSNRTVPLSELLTDEVLLRLYALLFPDLNALRGQVEVVVTGSVDQPYGKWPQVLGNVVLMSSRWLPLMLRDFLPQNLQQNPDLLLRALQRLPGYVAPESVTVDSVLAGIPANQYAMQVVVPFTNRLEAYLQSETEDRNRWITDWCNQIALAVGWDAPVQYATPVNDYMVGLDILRSLLQALYDICLVILFVYCGLVIYTLLVANAETKTYEFGMLRALGMRKNALVELMVAQALLFALPAILIALPLSYLSNIPVQFGVSYFTSTALDMGLSWTGVLIGSSVGLAMPIVANIVPIRRALSRTLRDALDLYHSNVGESLVRLQRLEDMGISPTQLLLALLLTFACFLFLYVYPWAFLYLRFAVIFFLTDMIFIGLMAGLAMFFGVLQERMEGWLVVAMLMPLASTRHLLPIIRKSLAAHGSRNRKTAVMVTLVATFVIFAGVSLKLETETAERGYRVLVGSHLLFYSIFPANPLDELSMRQFLETQTPSFKSQMEQQSSTNGTSSSTESSASGGAMFWTGCVEEYSFVTYPLGQLDGYLDTQLSNVLGRPWNPVFFVGLEERYLNSIYDDLIVVNEVDEAFTYNETASGMPNFVQSLVVNAGQARVSLDDQLPPDGVFPVLGSGTASSGVPLFGTPVGGVYHEYIDAVISKADEGGDVYQGDPLALQIHFMMTHEDTDAPYAPTMNYLVKARATVAKLPGFIFSWIKTLSLVGQPCLVSMDAFRRVQADIHARRQTLHGQYGMALSPSFAAEPPADPPKQALHVKFVEGTTPEQRNYVVNQLRSYVPNDTTFASDTTDLLSIIDSVMNLLQYFFMTGIAITNVLCFFVLWITCYSNIYENQWEFAVLRALGLSGPEVIGIYALEMMVVTTTSLLTGSMVGTLLSISLTLQNDIWGNWPFQFYFPVYIFGFLTLVTWFITFLGSYIPAQTVAKRPIASVLKSH